MLITLAALLTTILAAGGSTIMADSQSTSRWAKSPETRARISASLTGKKQSEETRAKRGAALKGRVFSAEHRAKISAAHMGKVVSAETRARMSAGMKGRKGRMPSDAERAATSARMKGSSPSAETREKMRAAKLARPTNYWLGKKRGPHSSEWKAKQSASLKGKPAAYPLQRFYYEGVPFRSTYEVRAAQAFNRLGMVWTYEPKRFDLGGSYTYLPDFYLPDEDMYVEVKGYYGPKSAETMSRMLTAHPDVSVAILQRLQIEALERVAAQVPQCVNH